MESSVGKDCILDLLDHLQRRQLNDSTVEAIEKETEVGVPDLLEAKLVLLLPV